ncbi:hypothetical protein EGT56_11775 [Arachnia propionica]|nr:hypothetical protein EGT56_11775 [Arachnia propionica]
MHSGFDSTGSLALAGRLNQLRTGQSWLSRVATKERPVSKPSCSRITGPIASSRMCARWFRLDRLAGACWSVQPTSDRTKLVEPARERQRTAVSKPFLAPGRRSRPAGGADLSGAVGGSVRQ